MTTSPNGEVKLRFRFSEVIAEFSMIYHWSYRDMMSCPASAFFLLLKQGRRIKRRDMSEIYYELSHVALMPNLTQQAQESMRDHYFHRATEGERDPVIQEIVPVIPDDPKTARAKGEAVLGLFHHKRRMEYGR